MAHNAAQWQQPDEPDTKPGAYQDPDELHADSVTSHVIIGEAVWPW